VVLSAMNSEDRPARKKSRRAHVRPSVVIVLASICHIYLHKMVSPDGYRVYVSVSRSAR
jgi:hypothetical protein